MPEPLTQTAYLAGGCFWGMEELLRNIPGVLGTEVGYSGGNSCDASYQRVTSGTTGHAEVLKILYDPDRLSYRHLLFEFLRMHNPTTQDRQGNDRGTQYRSAIFYADAIQQRIALEVLKTADDSGEWPEKIVTDVAKFEAFYRAEACHQNYLLLHPHGYSCHYFRPMGLGETLPRTPSAAL